MEAGSPTQPGIPALPGRPADRHELGEVSFSIRMYMIVEGLLPFDSLPVGSASQ